MKYPISEFHNKTTHLNKGVNVYVNDLLNTDHRYFKRMVGLNYSSELRLGNEKKLLILKPPLGVWACLNV